MATQMEAWRSVLDDHVGPECLHLLVASDLLHAVERVSSGQVYLSPGVSQAVVSAYQARPGKSADPLTLRERQVLQPSRKANPQRTFNASNLSA
jgi:DNA-binding NarL/FixJ family response regulator